MEVYRDIITFGALMTVDIFYIFVYYFMAALHACSRSCQNNNFLIFHATKVKVTPIA